MQGKIFYDNVVYNIDDVEKNMQDFNGRVGSAISDYQRPLNVWYFLIMQDNPDEMIRRIRQEGLRDNFSIIDETILCGRDNWKFYRIGLPQQTSFNLNRVLRGNSKHSLKRDLHLKKRKAIDSLVKITLNEDK